MIMGMSLEQMCEEIGHDGLMNIPRMYPPWDLVGHHIQEITDVLWENHRHAVVVCDLYPMIQRDCHIEPFIMQGAISERFHRYLSRGHGVLQCKTRRGTGHAIAWDFDNQRFYDPAGAIYNYPSSLWVQGDTLDIAGLEPYCFFLVLSHE
jgi:hypothetical protein